MMYAANIREVWDVVVVGLREVVKIIKADWIPEDIYHEVLSGKSFIFMHSSDNESFVVLSKRKNPYLDSSVLIVDVAYNKTGDAIDQYQPLLEELAKEVGAGYIEFSSPRSGFKRVADKHGYTSVCTTYRKQL